MVPGDGLNTGLPSELAARNKKSPGEYPGLYFKLSLFERLDPSKT